MSISKYTKEFIDVKIQLMLNDNKSVSKIVPDLDIHVKTLYNYMSSYKKEHKIPMRVVNTSSSTETLNEDNKCLRQENKILNHRPRKVLGYKTPYEVFFSEMSRKLTS